MDPPELPPVVGQAFVRAVLGRVLQHHDMDRAGRVAAARAHAALPVPRGAGLDVGDGQRAGEQNGGDKNR